VHSKNSASRDVEQSERLTRRATALGISCVMEIPRMRTDNEILLENFFSYIYNMNQKSTETVRRQIKRDLTACAFALEHGPDICSDEDKLIIFNEMQCCIDKIKHLNSRLKSPQVALLPSAPAEGGPVPTVVEKKTKATPKYDTVEKVDNYLKSHITDENCYEKLMADEDFNNIVTLQDIAKTLEDSKGLADGASLQIYYRLGTKLNVAKARFSKIKRKVVNKQKWSQWVKQNVGLSASHCSKIIAVANLLTKYPKLRSLKGVSFTELYNLRKKITELFSNEDIVKNWPNELCMLCYTHPRASTGFLSCVHGQHYCKKCIAKLMKDRKASCEVNDDEHGLIQFTETLKGGRCPECRKVIVLPPTHNYNLRPRRK
jgi:hypothetical protein